MSAATVSVQQATIRQYAKRLQLAAIGGPVSYTHLDVYKRQDYTRLAASMFARWSQENFFRYMRATLRLRPAGGVWNRIDS